MFSLFYLFILSWLSFFQFALLYLNYLFWSLPFVIFLFICCSCFQFYSEVVPLCVVCRFSVPPTSHCVRPWSPVSLPCLSQPCRLQFLLMSRPGVSLAFVPLVSHWFVLCLCCAVFKLLVAPLSFVLCGSFLVFLGCLVFIFQLCLIKLACWSLIQPPMCCMHFGPHLV